MEGERAHGVEGFKRGVEGEEEVERLQAGGREARGVRCEVSTCISI